MGIRIRGPRLNLRDIEDLMSAHGKLVALDRLLHGTNWAGAPACVILAGEVDVLVARLYNKAERAMVRDPVVTPAPPSGEIAETISRAAWEGIPADAVPIVQVEEKIQRCIHGVPADQHCGLCAIGTSSG